MNLRNKTIIILGGSGTFGRAFLHRLLKTDVQKVIIFSRDEFKQSQMQQEERFKDPRIRYFIGDVRDYQRLRRAFEWVNIVVNAAALKQIGACEYNPREALYTNCIGAQNIIDAALDCGTEQVLHLSTDKATAPVNCYGASKLMAEKLFLSSNSYSGNTGPRFSCVRYGNIAGSRGSVIPLFRKLIDEGADSLPITDASMTRFWFDIEGAIDLVLYALDNMCGGEVYVPKLPSFRIIDLAKAMAPGMRLKLIGIRPGEKLHESMIGPDESYEFRDDGHCYVRSGTEGNQLPSGFDYSSGDNVRFLTVDELAEMVGQVATV